MLTKQGQSTASIATPLDKKQKSKQSLMDKEKTREDKEYEEIKDK